MPNLQVPDTIAEIVSGNRRIVVREGDNPEEPTVEVHPVAPSTPQRDPEIREQGLKG